MKKVFFVLAFLFTILQLSLITVDQYYQYLLGKTTTMTINLTSLMTPFKYINRNPTFYCSESTLEDRYKLEFLQLERYRLNQLYKQPPINRYYTNYMTSTLPYFYSLWKTSSFLPRLITPCEHQVYIKLMKTFDQICRENDIEYMISHGTLLGSYRNHDILPYDDDVDMLIHVKYYSRLAKLNQTSDNMNWQFYLNTPRNMKFYFRLSPSAGNYKWKWPFIGIQFFTDNSTHIKLEQSISKDIIYPLVLRPIATLLLPGPRYVHKYLNALQKDYFSKMSIDDQCLLKSYSHRDERPKYQQRIINCTNLYNIYPYIRRKCGDDYCDEYLMLNNITILYVLKMTKDK